MRIKICEARRNVRNRIRKASFDSNAKLLRVTCTKWRCHFHKNCYPHNTSSQVEAIPCQGTVVCWGAMGTFVDWANFVSKSTNMTTSALQIIVFKASAVIRSDTKRIYIAYSVRLTSIFVSCEVLGNPRYQLAFTHFIKLFTCDIIHRLSPV